MFCFLEDKITETDDFAFLNEELSIAPKSIIRYGVYSDFRDGHRGAKAHYVIGTDMYCQYVGTRLHILLNCRGDRFEYESYSCIGEAISVSKFPKQNFIEALKYFPEFN